MQVILIACLTVSTSAFYCQTKFNIKDSYPCGLIFIFQQTF